MLQHREFDQTWLVCKPCHREIRASNRAEKADEFKCYQRKAARYEEAGPRELGLFWAEYVVLLAGHR